jgi:hypothetical protein
MTRKLHVLQTPFARYMTGVAIAQAQIAEAMKANAAAQPSVQVNATTFETIPVDRPQTQRLRMIDDDGLKYLNESRAKRAARNAKRAEHARRSAVGQRRQ